MTKRNRTARELMGDGIAQKSRIEHFWEENR
jgi:hypothetical protein